MAQTAKRLGMSQRTLQRRLQDAGRSFQDLFDDVRRELALRHLAAGNLTICEIANRVGFTDLRAFYRAFKRWTGTAPGQYRAHAHAMA
ncbi:helix-turn-helix transcriptional regulator [Nannocystis pusilla]|uniref:helix-turn-helix transcriptional regulator n=1 Tax=Nannocystis pusilla TaxID=889268 RepID=UPI003B8274E6